MLKTVGVLPLVLRSAPLFGLDSLVNGSGTESHGHEGMALADVRLRPHYPTTPPVTDVLRLIPAGSDQFITEKYAVEIETVLKHWGETLRTSISAYATAESFLAESIQATSLIQSREILVRSSYGIKVLRRIFGHSMETGREQFVKSLGHWLENISQIETAEFEIYRIDQVNSSPLTVDTEIRYDLVSVQTDKQRQERVGSWAVKWSLDLNNEWRAVGWQANEETLSVVAGSAFVDITKSSFSGVTSYADQLLRGADYWRTTLDGAIGVDVYGNNGVATGDYDDDGFDDLYVCQPAGLPNRLYKNRGDGTFVDVTEHAGVGVLDNTPCALFVDFRNIGRQDLLVVCGSGPVLFLNQGNGTFAIRPDAFKFSQQPQGTFTHAAVADYDGDGRLDVYFCTYMYYLGLDQYHYPIPYYDARNGPPNCLFHNEGDGTFIERTDAAGLNAQNDRYSFACAWGDANSDGFPDLFVANDFGSSQLYRNSGNGKFVVASKEANIESVGAGMSCCWVDYNNDGRQDVYVPSMWEAAGQRISTQKQFHPNATETVITKYRRHARGNALYRNRGDGTFENVGEQTGVAMGRWSWSSDFWDIDHDGYVDLYVANGYLSGPSHTDLAGFFWRQVVANSPDDATPSQAYERGWNGINESIRSENTWHGRARNVLFVNNQDGTFAEASGSINLDFTEDSRAFALADIDHDGRLEVILKNRNSPQIRVLHNVLNDIGACISFKVRGNKSNRDGIGTVISVECGFLRQTKYLQAGTGFLSQHAKELFFGLGKTAGPIRAHLRWPSGLEQSFDDLPINCRIEVEEGVVSFRKSPFSRTRIPRVSDNLSFTDALPATVETWLLDPFKAPDFSAPDLTGKSQTLKSFRGQPLLLTFWSMHSPSSLQQLKALSIHSGSTKFDFAVLALNVDEPADQTDARIYAKSNNLGAHVSFATQETEGIYNLIYRHLFDRRRDLPVPCSFLLDGTGMIVKIYQGYANPSRILEDIRTIPTDAASRTRLALPFRGIVVQDAFARNDFTFGVAMYQHGYFDQAAASFQEVIAAKPDNADAYYNLGTLDLHRNNFEQARKYLEQTIKFKPDYPEAWNNLGMISAQLGSFEEAVKNFQQSLNLRPNYATALLNLGNVYRRQKNFQDAQSCLTRALKLQPDDPETLYSLGLLYAQLNQVDQASESLHRAIELRPSYAEAHNNLGVLYVRQRDFAHAELEFRAGIEAAPQFDQSYLNLARLYAMENNVEKARDVLKELLRLQPQNDHAKQAMEMLQ